MVKLVISLLAIVSLIGCSSTQLKEPAQQTLSNPALNQQQKTPHKDRARPKIAEAQLKSISAALERYEMENGFYPTTEQGLNALMEKPTIAPIPLEWSGPYLTMDPIDPWGRDIRYSCPSIHNNPILFDLWSLGPDGKEGTEDDITNWKK